MRGLACEVGQDDCSPATVLTDLLTNTRYGLGIDASAIEVTSGPDGLATSGYDTYCKAMGFRVSAALTSRGEAMESIRNLLDSTNSMAVWSNGKIKVVPLGDTSITAHGVTYNPPSTATALGEDDFLVSDPTEDPIEVTRAPPESCANVHPVRYASRAFTYQDRTVEAMVVDAVDSEGLKRASDFSSEWITTEPMAYAIAGLRAQRNASIRNFFTFRLGLRHAYLEPGDLVALTDSHLGISGLVCRIRSMEEDGDGFVVEAEERPVGVASIVVQEVQTTDGIGVSQANYTIPAADTAFSLASSQITPSRFWDFGPTGAGWILAGGYSGEILEGTFIRLTPTTTDLVHRDHRSEPEPV